MRATVLNDPALAKQAGRFAWLSINGEESRNAAFVDRLAIEGYPTFYVLDGATGKTALRWAGSLTLPELERLLDDGERAVANTGGSPAEAAMARADRLLADGKAAEAAAAYDEAIGLAPAGWVGRGRAINARLGALHKTSDLETCASLARREAPGLERGPAFAAAAATGLTCAAEAPAEAAWRAAAMAELEPLVETSLGLDNVLADDRSSAYGMLVEMHDGRGDAAGAKAMAGRWMEFLDTQGKAAATIEARAALDGHRVAAALALEDPARAVPALVASERDLPGDYNPPARLAVLYREMGRYDDALAASDRALERAYGARKLRILDTRADIFERKGDPAAARRTIEEALHYADTLPETQRPQAFIAQLRKRASG